MKFSILNFKFSSQEGFTLMELITVITVMMILTVATISMFARALKNSSYAESQRLIDGSAKSIIDSLGRYFREVQVISLDNDVVNKGRDSCLNAPAGIAGSRIRVASLDGSETDIALSNSELSSNGARLNPSNVMIGDLAFVWKCDSGTSDRLDVSFTASVSGTPSEGYEDTLKKRSYVFGVVLRNVQ